MSGVTGGLVAATAAASIGTGIAGMVDPQEQQFAAPGRYIPPSVSVKEANAQNAKVLAKINKVIKRNNKYQKRLERERHAESRADIEWFRAQRESAVEMADPYVKERRGYIQKMQALMDDPSSFLEKSPEYRARMAGGLEALTSQLASRGLIGSGNVAIEAQALGAREAAGQMGKDWERLAKLSGLMDSNLAAAADIQAGARIPIQGPYTPRFEAQQFHPAQGVAHGQQLNPGQMFTQPDQRIAFGNEITGGLGLLAGAADTWQQRQMADELRQRSGFVNDQGFVVPYG